MAQMKSQQKFRFQDVRFILMKTTPISVIRLFVKGSAAKEGWVLRSRRHMLTLLCYIE